MFNWQNNIKFRKNSAIGTQRKYYIFIMKTQLFIRCTLCIKKKQVRIGREVVGKHKNTTNNGQQQRKSKMSELYFQIHSLVCVSWYQSKNLYETYVISSCCYIRRSVMVRLKELTVLRMDFVNIVMFIWGAQVCDDYFHLFRWIIKSNVWFDSFYK